MGIGKIHNGRIYTTVDPEIRFWSKVKKDNSGCWYWNGHRAVRSVLNVGGRNVYCSRFAYESHFKTKIPKGLMACHACDNLGCVNPNHIFIGTQTDNMQDCLKKGRFNNSSHASHGEKIISINFQNTRS